MNEQSLLRVSLPFWKYFVLDVYIFRVLNLAEDSPLVQSLDIEGREDITSSLEISEHYIYNL